ncbi:uncharacterized protein LOC129579291 isoform X2 [Sitodiplosis mosellana]|uniref:uncharacterized protein LOC129579291 isoform X2 n=1 Tax=Sitodiplosis mosellana TaxID=263140 RepID=UPI002443AD47|nr:uncharacterized protein LOC129579291 isoform X2 [Sitodiplosis mosellana]
MSIEIKDLPLEILQRICNPLNLEQLKNVRFVNKAFQSAVDYVLATQHENVRLGFRRVILKDDGECNRLIEETKKDEYKLIKALGIAINEPGNSLTLDGIRLVKDIFENIIVLDVDFLPSLIEEVHTILFGQCKVLKFLLIRNISFVEENNHSWMNMVMPNLTSLDILSVHRKDDCTDVGIAQFAEFFRNHPTIKVFRTTVNALPLLKVALRSAALETLIILEGGTEECDISTVFGDLRQLFEANVYKKLNVTIDFRIDQSTLIELGRLNMVKLTMDAIIDTNDLEPITSLKNVHFGGSQIKELECLVRKANNIQRIYLEDAEPTEMEQFLKINHLIQLTVRNLAEKKNGESISTKVIDIKALNELRRNNTTSQNKITLYLESGIVSTLL